MRTIVLTAAALFIAGSGSAQTDWPTFGHDLAGTRYSPLKQINPANVRKLTRAWTYHMTVADAAPQAIAPNAANDSAASPPADGRGRGGRGRGGFNAGGRGSEVSPLVINGVMYLTTAFNRIVALEPETAKELWTYEVKDGSPATRGLEFWEWRCSISACRFLWHIKRQAFYALNAKTGKPNPGFGNEGIVDMKPGALNGLTDSSFGLSSPPIVYKNALITGAHVQEGPSVGSAGDTRAWDVHTGKLLWQFHSVPRPGETGSETWQGDDWKNRSGTNVWGIFTIDQQRGILYMPFGEPTTDYWGGDRKGNNLFGTSLVGGGRRLRASSNGIFRRFITTPGIIDLAGPPILFDVTQKGKKIPAVAEISKSGLLYILNRVTGEPIFGMQERKVPTDDAVPGDFPSPTSSHSRLSLPH